MNKSNNYPTYTPFPCPQSALLDDCTLQLTMKSYQLLIDNTKDYAIFMLDPQGYILTWNKGAERIKGYQAKDIIGRHISCFYTPDALANQHPLNELAIAAKQGRYEEESWRVRKDGSRFWANVIITALYDEKNKLIGFGKITRDLTERKQVEEALRQREEQLRLILDSTQDYAIIMLDPNGYISTWNKGAAKILGYSPPEIIGRHFSTFYTPDALTEDAPSQELKIAREHGRYEEEGWRMRKDGSRFWASIIVSPAFDAQQQLIGFSKITRDLTEKKRMENLKRDFISIISHELRTPLTSIQGSLMLIAGKLDLLTKATLSELTHIAINNCERLARLVNDILDIEQIENGKMRFKYAPIQLATVIETAILSNEMYAKKYEINLTTHTLLKDVMVFADSDRLIQAITNLLSNAIKFSPPNQEVIISMEHHASSVRVLIQDFGTGIPANFKDNLFAKFSQADSSSRRHKNGSGLGLAITKAIIEQHHGHIGYENKVGSCVFFFDLPVLNPT